MESSIIARNVPDLNALHSGFWRPRCYAEMHVRRLLLVDIVFMPLMLAFIAATWSNSKVLENLHRSRNFRMLVSGETAVVVFGLAAAFLTLFIAWTAGV